MLDLREEDSEGGDSVFGLQHGAVMDLQPPVCGMPTPSGGTCGKPRGHSGKCG